MNAPDPLPDPAMLVGMENLIAAMKDRPPADVAQLSSPELTPLPSSDTHGMLAGAPWQAVGVPAGDDFEEALRESRRFDIVRRLGEGGMGVVYHAHDRVRGLDVAIKTLMRMGPTGILRLKREFRAIADLTHRNLISLYELVCADDRWFFTMELVRGVDVIVHVRPEGTDDDPGLAPTERRPTPPVSPLASTERRPGAMVSPFAPTDAMPRPPVSPLAITDPLPRPPCAVAGVIPRPIGSPLAPAEAMRWPPIPLARRRSGRLEPARLRAALEQLVDAVTTLHAAGKVHLDLKPSNVLVDEAGRVVVLDFGVLQDVSTGGLAAGGHALAGTPLYMAPEQLVGELSPASDWYAVGVILYEALTGHLPFSGALHEIVKNKVRLDPVPPIAFDAAIDPALSSLCMRLLHRQRNERAGGAEVLQSIRHLPHLREPRARRAAQPSDTAGPMRGTMLGTEALRTNDAMPAPERTMFVGRGQHLQALADAFESARNGRGMALYVHGRSGMGKSALLQRFEDVLRTDPNILVLSGRCYEREAVPFKALDGIIDALALHLKRIPRPEAASLLPEGIHDLARVFPILGMIPAIADVPHRVAEIVDPYELRIRAFRALKLLLRQLARRVPLVMRIDDLQWGDRDSALLLSDLLGPPDPPALLLVCTYRSEDEQTSPCLLELFDPAAARLAGAEETRKLHLGPLTGDESEELARSLLNDSGKGAGLATELAREAAGSPYFLTELVRHVGPDAEAPRDGQSIGPLARVTSLDTLLLGRIAALPDPARRVLEVIAVAGQPLEQGLARQSVDPEGLEPSALLALRSGHFVRTGGLEATDTIETYHDRVRELVVEQIDPVRLVGHHRRLAEQLESTGRADPERLATHFHGAGDRHKAADYAVTAADKAAGALAFDNAARLYRMALEWSPGDDARHHELFAKLGDALANAGRGPEAAQAYDDAASRATAGAMPLLALEDKRLAAEQFLKSGHTAAGVKVLREVLAAVDLGYPETPEQAIEAWRARQAEIDARGWGFEARDASSLDPAVLRRIDVCFSAFIGLFTVDSVGAFSFHGQHVLLSLAAGEPTRIALGLAFETMFAAKTGALVRMRSAYVAVEAVLEQAANPRAECVLRIARGIRCFLNNWKEAMEHGLEAERIAREECTGVAWEVATAQLVCVLSLTARGELEELGRRLPSWIKEGEEHGNRYAVTSLSTFMGGLTLLAVARGDVTGARKELDRVMAMWSEQGFSIQHYHAVYSHALIDMYCGHGAEAWRRVEAVWPAIERSGLLGLQTVRAQALDLRGRAALAGSESAADAEPALRIAEEVAEALEQQEEPWPCALALALRAGIADRRGDAAQAQSCLRDAIFAFEALDMALHAASARKRLGVLLGGEEGKALGALADAFMRSRTIREPDGIAAAFAPGFRERREAQR